MPPPLILRGAPKKWGKGAEKGKGAPKRGERRRNRQKSRKGGKWGRKRRKKGKIGGIGKKGGKEGRQNVKRGRRFSGGGQKRHAPKCTGGVPIWSGSCPLLLKILASPLLRDVSLHQRYYVL